MPPLLAADEFLSPGASWAYIAGTFGLGLLGVFQLLINKKYDARTNKLELDNAECNRRYDSLEIRVKHCEDDRAALRKKQDGLAQKVITLMGKLSENRPAGPGSGTMPKLVDDTPPG